PSVAEGDVHEYLVSWQEIAVGLLGSADRFDVPRGDGRGQQTDVLGNAARRGSPELGEDPRRQGQIMELDAVDEPLRVFAVVIGKDEERGVGIRIAEVRGVDRESAVEGLPGSLLHRNAVDEAHVGPRRKVNDQCQAVPLAFGARAAVVPTDTDSTTWADEPVAIVLVAAVRLEQRGKA